MTVLVVVAVALVVMIVATTAAAVVGDVLFIETDSLFVNTTGVLCRIVGMFGSLYKWQHVVGVVVLTRSFVTNCMTVSRRNQRSELVSQRTKV